LLLLFQFWATELPVIRRLLSAAIVMIALGAAISLQRHYVQFAEKCAGRMEIARALQTGFKGAPIASYYGASTPAHALWFGNLWAGNRYTKPLAKILESDAPAYWIHGPSGEVFFMGQQVANLQDFCRDQSSFILAGWVRSTPRIFALLPPNARIEKVLERSDEVITKVTVE